MCTYCIVDLNKIESQEDSWYVTVVLIASERQIKKTLYLIWWDFGCLMFDALVSVCILSSTARLGCECFNRETTAPPQTSEDNRWKQFKFCSNEIPSWPRNGLNIVRGFSLPVENFYRPRMHWCYKMKLNYFIFLIIENVLSVLSGFSLDFWLVRRWPRETPALSTYVGFETARKICHMESETMAKIITVS